MPLSDKYKEIQRLTAIADDSGQPPESRILAARKLLRDTEHSLRSVRVAKRTAKLFTRETATHEIQKKAKSLLKYVADERESEQDKTEGGQPSIPENLNLETTLEEALPRRNKDARAVPMPSKFLYFPRGDRDYLIKNYADLCDIFGYTAAVEIDESFFEDEYNKLPEAGSRFHRSLNPLWLKNYAEWKESKFGVDTIPDRQSVYFWMFVHDEEVRRWNKLGTLLTPEEQPVGAELRKRLLRSGEIKRSEISFLWALWWAVALKKADKWYAIRADTPIMYLHEFPGIERRKVSDEISAAKVTATQRTPEKSFEITTTPMPVQQPRQPAGFARPIGTPNEICSYCDGRPAEAPPHDCLNYMIPVSYAEFVAASAGPVIRTR